MMWNLVMLLLMAMEMIFASISASNGDVAKTILYCFSAYFCLQFMKKDGGGNVD